VTKPYERGRRPVNRPAETRGDARIPAAAGPVVIAIAAALMLARTWGTWPDAIVDFGREIYLAWRLASGDTLYVDVSHFSGPLSPYLNALWFRLFGIGLRTLVLANIALAVGLLALLHQLLVRLAGRLAAAAACLVFVALFACAQYTRIGNYNWICPYSHELTHGVMLVVAALSCLDRYHRTQAAGWMGALGVTLGLLVLTKAEVLLAGAAASGVAVLLTLVVERPASGRAARLLALLVGGAALPLLVTALCFASAMPLEDVLRWPLGHWHTVLRPELSGTKFYQEGLGLADAAGNARALGMAALGYGAVLLAAVVAAFALPRVRAPLPLLAGGVCLATLYVLRRLVTLDAWVHSVPRPLPAIMALIVVVFVAEAVRRRAEREEALRAVRAAALGTFALVLLAKMILNVRLFQYGFVLAMPATITLVVAMVAWVPAVIERAGGRGAIVQAVAAGALVAAVLPQLAFQDRLIAAKVHRVGRGADAFWADERGQATMALVEQIGARVGRTETMAVIPEGAMVSYLARRVNPTPYYLFDRTTLALWGEGTMVAALDAAAPEWVAFLDRGDGGSAFGQSVGTATYDWVAEHYRPEWRLGRPFSGTRGVSAALLRRAD